MPTPPHDIGGAVYAALTDDERAMLARSIRTARASYYGDQSDDWLCCILQNRIDLPGLGERDDEVTDDDLRETCVALVPLLNHRDFGRALRAFGSIHRERVSGLYLDAIDDLFGPADYEAIGRRVFGHLTSEDRKRMKEALEGVRAQRDDPIDPMRPTWRRELARFGHGEPIEQGVRITNRHVLAICQLLAKLHDTARRSPGHPYVILWPELVSGAFGYEHAERIECLFAEARKPLIKTRTKGK
ncbi:hypothetical protein ACFQE0_14795 [Methylobacterium komagatae]|uniref:Uncharacterized protein n=1 Tax=Methylobacterium komagatae TaxID=374425 RepID=A0ABW2BK45_9HYPH